MEVAGDARPVSMVAGDACLLLKEPFLVDISPPGVGYVAVRRVMRGRAAPAAAAVAPLTLQEAARRELEAATGVTASSMRVNKAGTKSYTTAPIVGGEGLSREQLLDLRSKAKGEKVL